MLQSYKKISIRRLCGSLNRFCIKMPFVLGLHYPISIQWTCASVFYQILSRSRAAWISETCFPAISVNFLGTASVFSREKMKLKFFPSGTSFDAGKSRDIDTELRLTTNSNHLWCPSMTSNGRKKTLCSLTLCNTKEIGMCLLIRFEKLGENGNKKVK